MVYAGKAQRRLGHDFLLLVVLVMCVLSLPVVATLSVQGALLDKQQNTSALLLHGFVLSDSWIGTLEVVGDFTLHYIHSYLSLHHLLQRLPLHV